MRLGRRENEMMPLQCPTCCIFDSSEFVKTCSTFAVISVLRSFLKTQLTAASEFATVLQIEPIRFLACAHHFI